MKKYFKRSLNRRLSLISIVVFIPMFCLAVILMVSLMKASHAYSEITHSVSYANQYVKDFKERIDYSMYLAVIGNMGMEELGNEEKTVNGIVTVNPYEYISEMEQACDHMAEVATVNINKNQIQRLKSSLKSLRKCVGTLEAGIKGNQKYEENKAYLDENINNLTTLIQTGIQDYIYTETTHLDEIKEHLDAKNANTLAVSIGIFAVTIFLSLILTNLAARSVTRPIKKLCKQTSRVAEGDFTVKAKVEAGDEIAMLTESFNDMTKEIGRLVEDIKQKQQNLHITEMKLLQAQINPHFLYNTLDAIVWLAEEKKNSEVVSMVTALSDFFRTTLSEGQDQIKIREERSHIESYLKIQRFRYQDIMEYEIKMDSKIDDYWIPKLTLQPFVENALYHGIKNKRGMGRICITGKLEGERILFSVEDNGIGMEEEQFVHLQKELEDPKTADMKAGFGIVNVAQRLNYYYGNQSKIIFESEKNKGTIVKIIIGIKKIEPFS